MPYENNINLTFLKDQISTRKCLFLNLIIVIIYSISNPRYEDPNDINKSHLWTNNIKQFEVHIFTNIYNIPQLINTHELSKERVWRAKQRGTFLFNSAKHRYAYLLETGSYYIQLRGEIIFIMPLNKKNTYILYIQEQ